MPFPGDAVAAVQLEDPAGDVVEEVAVVGDGDDRPGKLLQVPLQPGDRLGVEMVRRLVQQEEIGLLQQHAAERDAAALAAREVRDLGVPRRTAKRVHRDLDLAGPAPSRRACSIFSCTSPCSSRRRSISSGSIGSAKRALISSKRCSRSAHLRDALLDVLLHVLRRIETAAPGRGKPILIPGPGVASPRCSVSSPAMIRSSEDLPAPFGAEDADLRADRRTRARCPAGRPCRAGWTLPTSFIVKMNGCATKPPVLR